MATWSELSVGAKASAVAVVALLAGGGGYGFWLANQKEPVAVAADPAATQDAVAEATAPAAEAPADQAATPDASVAAPDAPAEPAVEGEAGVQAAEVAVDGGTAEAAATPETVTTEAAQPAETVAAPEVAASPSIDITRIEPDGTALVAGQAVPGAVVSLLMNGVEVAAATADPNGKFVALFSLPAGEGGRLMTLRATLPDGQVVPGVGQVAVAAIAAPVAVAEASEPAVVAEPAPAVADTGEAAVEPAPSDSGTVEAAPAETAAAEAPATEAAPETTTAALSVTDEGVKVLQSGTEVPADVAANVSLDVIAYPSMSEVQFGGRGAAGSFVRLYLDNAPVGEPVKIDAGGSWTATIAGIEPRIFTLRVDQLDTSGKVTSRFETPFKRETPEALAAAADAAAVPEVAAEPRSSTQAPEVAVEPEVAALPEDAAKPEVAASAADVPAATDTGVADAAAQVAVPDTETQPATQTPTEPAIAEPAQPDSTAAIPPAAVTVTVQPGFTLWSIAQETFGSGVLYVQVFEANRDKIRDPDLIYPGQIFTIPGGTENVLWRGGAGWALAAGHHTGMVATTVVEQVGDGPADAIRINGIKHVARHFA